MSLGVVLFFGAAAVFGQTAFQPGYYTPNQPNNAYLAKSSAFRQEIARVSIDVVRAGEAPLSVTQVPRLERGDVLKVRLLDEVINGVKPDQSNYDWSFLVAFVNPAYNNDGQKSVSEEIRFRKTGWYKEYSFTVPYDSQPIFFLYPKPNYRAKILNLITKNQDEIRKIGEKTLEIAGAYAKIGSFLNELQFVLNRSSYGGYGGFGSYGSFGANQNQLMEQTVERLARSFNIQLPSCWGGGYGYTGGYTGGYNSTYNTGGYNSGYSAYGGYGTANDFAGRVQCVAKNVRLEDFDLSVSRLLQQGGILVASQLAQKYPQIAHWINIAAIALDFILKLTKKTPLKIVPTIISTSETAGQTAGYQGAYTGAAYNSGATYNPSYNSGGFAGAGGAAAAAASEAVKISLFAESPPNDNDFVTAYPLVVHKWQAEADPETIALPVPSLIEACLHAGQNVLRSTDLMNDWAADAFTKDFRLVVTSPNGFRKEFPLRKNAGLSGWELHLTKEDLLAFPKIKMTLESEIVGRRGFNEVKSPKFDLPIAHAAGWEIEAESQKAFAVGDKRTIRITNQLGTCRCLQAVVYKPSFGGQFVFEANSKENGLQFSADGKEVSLTLDTANFQPGAGQLELRQYGGEVSTLNINLYPPPPRIASLRIARGDRQALLTGERLEQIRAVRINGKRAPVEGYKPNAAAANSNPGMYASANQANAAVNNQNGFAGNQSSAFGAGSGMSGGAPGERIAAFEDPAARQDGGAVTLELELDDERRYKYPQTFAVSPARPAIVAGQGREVEAAATNNSASEAAARKGGQTVAAASRARAAFDVAKLPVFPIDTAEVSVTVQNALTDYDFRVENIGIETRIENVESSAGALPKANFEVLDWKNMRVSFALDAEVQRFLGGRRLQFRIRDKQRGVSDWYTVRKTFVRMPASVSVKCGGAALGGNCELRGEGIEYLSQVSVDGGRSWFPQAPATLTAATSAEGAKAIAIPRLANRKLLRLRLRDLPNGDGLAPF